MPVEAVDSASALEAYLQDHLPVVVVLAENIAPTKGEGQPLDPWPVAERVLEHLPLCSVIMLVRQETPEVLKKALQTGVDEVLCLPLYAELPMADLERVAAEIEGFMLGRA